MNWPVSGGSNLLWHRQDADGHLANVLTYYDTERDAIDATLDQMRANGQHRLRLMLHHLHDGERCENPGRRQNSPDSTGGLLSPQVTANLFALLSTIKAKGFSEIAFTFGPQWTTNSPETWPGDWPGQAWYEFQYSENLDLISFVRLIVKASGLNAKFDLMNEGIPPKDDPRFAGQTEYCRRLWADYNARYGKNDTFGFSVAGPDATRIANFDTVYGSNPPYLLDLHIYGFPVDKDPVLTTKEAFLLAHERLREAGYHQGCIIGECLYGSTLAAFELREAMLESGRTVFWLTQWPLGTDMKNHTPPVGYAYGELGW